ncbi:contact-dependent growth inhibition system immunity protein, partial [Chitinimonas viridis]
EAAPMIVRTTRVKVGHRQAPLESPRLSRVWGFCFAGLGLAIGSCVGSGKCTGSEYRYCGAITMDLSKSIEQLESAVWEYNPYPSNVVQRGQRLRKLALESLSIDDLRFLIGQEIGLPYVLPLAFEHLAENPAAGGQMYPGDLLDSVLSVRAAFWRSRLICTGS